MSTVEIVGGIVILIIGLLICFVVVSQESPQKGGGLSALGGASDSFYSQNKGRTKDVLLSKATVVLGIVFALVCFLTHAVPLWLGTTVLPV